MPCRIIAKALNTRSQATAHHCHEGDVPLPDGMDANRMAIWPPNNLTAGASDAEVPPYVRHRAVLSADVRAHLYGELVGLSYGLAA